MDNVSRSTASMSARRRTDKEEESTSSSLFEGQVVMLSETLSPAGLVARFLYLTAGQGCT